MALRAEGEDIPSDVLAGLGPFWRSSTNRFGDYTLDFRRKVQPNELRHFDNSIRNRPIGVFPLLFYMNPCRPLIQQVATRLPLKNGSRT